MDHAIKKGNISAELLRRGRKQKDARGLHINKNRTTEVPAYAHFNQ